MSKTPSQSPVLDRVHLLVDPIVADLGLDLYDLEFVGGILKVVVDTPPLSDGGVTLETIALVTRLVSRELDLLEAHALRNWSRERICRASSTEATWRPVSRTRRAATSTRSPLDFAMDPFGR